MRKAELRNLKRPEYKDGYFKHRTSKDICKKYGGACYINRKQKDPKEDICEWCINNRDPMFSEKRSPI